MMKIRALGRMKQRIKGNRGLYLLFLPLIKIKSGILRLVRPVREDAYAQTVVGGHLIVQLKNVQGRFAISATSDLARRIISTAEYEPEVTALLKNYSNLTGVAVNIGANIGLFSVYLATNFKSLDKVFAIEPNPEAFKLLVENINTNSLPEKITAINALIGDQDKDVDFHCIRGKPEYSSIGGIVKRFAHGDIYQLVVRQRRLSDVIDGQPISLLFLDVEGAEELVFKGAIDVIAKHRPILLFECSDMLLTKFGSSSTRLEQFLNGLGYRLRDPSLAEANPIHHPFEGNIIAEYIGK